MAHYLTRSAARQQHAVQRKEDDTGSQDRNDHLDAEDEKTARESMEVNNIEEEPGELSTVKDAYETFYYDPSAPGSFGGVDGLHRQLRGVKTREEIRDWLTGQTTYSLHKPVRRRFKRNVILVHGVDEQFQADLADMSMLAKQNDSVTFLLTCVDVLTKYAWVIPMQNKSAVSTLNAFEKIFSERKPVKLQTDNGKEFENSVIRDYMVRKGVHHFFTYNTEIKCAIAERFNRTLKNKIWRYLTYKKTMRYIDVLPDLVHSYNNSHHRSIQMTPAEASDPSRTKQVWRNLYAGTSVVNKTPASRIKFKYKVGDYVRLSEERDVFQKGYKQGWTKEVFKVTKQSPHEPVVYRVEDLRGDPVVGSFYEVELQKAPKPETWEVEEILDTKKSGKNIEYFVKFKNYPDYANTWVPATQIHTESAP